MTELSYVSGSTDTHLLGRTIGAELDRVAATHGERTAVIARHQDVRWTYRQLHEAAEQAARALLALNVAKGDRVGMWSPNRVEWMVIQYATAKIGAILVNVNPAYRTSELRYALRQSGCSILVASRAFRETDYVAMLDEVRDDLPDLREIVLCDPLDAPGAGRAHRRTRTWSAFLDLADDVDVARLREREATLDFDDPINIQYTSGTTGAPKGATLSHHNILNNGFFVTEAMTITPEDRVCLPVPFYHCFGMVMGNLGFLTHGATVVLPAEAFDPTACLEAIEAEACTTVYGVPTMFIGMLGDPSFEDRDLSSLRTGIMAGSPCPVEVMKQVISRMHMDDVTICYGMTETSPVSTQSRADDDLERRTETVGAIHPFLEIKLVDPDTGRTVPRGERGELCTRGYSVMLGYWENAEATAQAIDAARWMHTGDLAVMREDGYVSIVGRIKDMIIRGGENVYPREVEEFIYTHPDVTDVQVFGVPDDRYGEAVAAWITTRDGADLDEEALRGFCKGQIASFKIPAHIRFVGEFPMTVTGKVQKFKMRDQMREELGSADGTAS